MNVNPFKKWLIRHRHQFFLKLSSRWCNVTPRVMEKYSHSVTIRLMKRYPDSSFISKAEGMLCFNVFGKIPLADQERPVCVIQHKPVPQVSVLSQLQQGTVSAQTAEF